MPLKTTCLYGLLIVLTVWPFAHIGLARRYDLSPWKLAGWGMYAAPRFDALGMEIFGRVGPDAAWEQVTTPTAAERAAGHHFLTRYRWLRRLAGTRALWDVVTNAHPAWREVRVVLFEPVLVRSSGMVAERRTTFLLPSGTIEISGAAP